MKTKDKVPLFSQCKKIKDLGIIIDSELCWWGTAKTPHLCRGKYNERDKKKLAPAPNIAELGDIFPDTVILKNLNCVNNGTKFSWEVHRNEFVFSRGVEWFTFFDYHIQSHCTEAQAGAAVVIWLAENNYLYTE